MGNNGWDIRIDRAGLTPPLTANEAFIMFHNPKTWGKTLATVDSANCDANPQILNVAPGQTASFRISRSTTTTLLLSRQHCSLWVFGCWDSVLEDVAYFNEAGFWSLVGGRRVTITWSTSVQKWGAIVLER